MGLGARLTHRTPDGIGWTIGYDLGVLDSASLYDVALLHVVRGAVRYVLDTDPENLACAASKKKRR